METTMRMSRIKAQMTSVPTGGKKQLGATDQLRHRLGNLPVLIRLQEEKHRRHP